MKTNEKNNYILYKFNIIRFKVEKIFLVLINHYNMKILKKKIINNNKRNKNNNYKYNNNNKVSNNSIN